MAASQQNLKPHLAKHRNIKFTVPIQKTTFDTLKDYTIPSSTSNGDGRLTQFVNYVSSKVNVENRYTPEQLKEHTEFVENFVRNFFIDFGNHTPEYYFLSYNTIFASNCIVRRGSSYEGTKIISPNEYDYIPIFAWSGNKAVIVEEVGERCELAGQGYGFINIKHGDLHKELPPRHLEENRSCVGKPSGSTERSSPPGTIPHGSSKLSRNILITLCDAITSYLSESENYKYVGERDHHKDPESPYPQGTISLHKYRHGTSIWLRIGAPTCTTDIDLSFAIEDVNMTKGWCAMVGDGNVYCARCDESLGTTHWTRSLIDPGLQDATNTLSRNHHHLFLTVKYINHLIKKSLNIKTSSSSYSYKMLLLQHQRDCQNENVGQCLEDVVNQFFTHEKHCISTLEINVYTYKLLRKVPDIDYPKRMIRLKISPQECAVLLWITQHVKHTINTSWWDMLLLEDLKPEDINKSDMLYSLLHIAQQVDTGTLIDVEWVHDVNTKTVIR
ncbi:unnamed protein product [Owenia fusiformis]|uniref:Uncharacterized protein n=1 Tax=Owenia fusiformis TaxID=6347 RepID=A0A8S4PNK5_OWEFU|nr:unnamed protein product [Owenia fusiformis]